MKIQDQSQILEQHDLLTHDNAQEFHTPAPIYPGVPTLPPAYNHQNSIIQTTKEFMEANEDCDKDNQVVMYNGLGAYLPALDESTQHKMETLHQAIADRQWELENLQTGHIPGHPLGPYNNTSL